RLRSRLAGLVRSSLLLRLRDQLQAHESAGAAHVQQSMRQDRRRPAGELEQRLALWIGLTGRARPLQLDTRHLLVLLWVHLPTTQYTICAETDEVIIHEQKRSARQSGLPPLDLAGGQLDAAKLSFFRMTAAATIQVAADVDGRVPMTLHAFRTDALVRVGPHFLARAGLDFEQGAAGPIRLGDEDAMPADEGITGVAACGGPRPPRELEIDLAGRGVQADKSTAGEDETPASAVEGCQHRASVTSQFVG